jgi:hypothetical protein
MNAMFFMASTHSLGIVQGPGSGSAGISGTGIAGGLGKNLASGLIRGISSRAAEALSTLRLFMLFPPIEPKENVVQHLQDYRTADGPGECVAQEVQEAEGVAQKTQAMMRRGDMPVTSAVTA